MGVSTRLMFAVALAVCVAGCAPEKFTSAFHHGSACPPPASVVAAWSPKVTYVPDPARNGQPAPGIAGRIYLFGPTPDYPIAGDGSLTVDMYDDTAAGGSSAATPIERWEFDPVTFKRLLKRDTVGMGYTVFLPWGTYRPDIKTVRLQVRYEPKGGNAVYAPGGPMTVDHGTLPTGPQVR